MEKLPPQNPIGVVKWRVWRNFKALIKHYPRQMVLIFVLVVIVCGVSVALYWSGRPASPMKGVQLVTGNGYNQTISKLEAQVPPQDPMDRVFYYSQIAQSYEALERYDKSLDNYLIGQQIIDTFSLDAQVSLYTAISDCYAKLHNDKDAAVYKQKANDRVKQYQNSPANLPQKVEKTMGQP